MWGIKVIIPNKLQGRVLEELHAGHTGIVRMKCLARSRVWWPGVEKQIKEMAQKCDYYQCLRNKPAPATVYSWTWPICPWQRLHMDFAGPFLGKSFFNYCRCPLKMAGGDSYDDDNCREDYCRIEKSIRYSWLTRAGSVR